MLRDMTTSDLWNEVTARRYDEGAADRFAPEVLDPTVAVLGGLAGAGAALEFAIDTGRVGIPLAEQGVPVTGIELSEPMVAQLRSKIDDVATLPVFVGDMATTVVPGKFSLVYLVWNTISNLRTQTEQVACFGNAARHLTQGGRFVVELSVPPLRRLPPGQIAVPFDIGGRHVGFDTLDTVTQQATSHHYSTEHDGSIRYGDHHYRYIWPSECDLMAQLAGMELENRWADWDASPFTADSTSHVSVWRKS